GRPVAGGIRGHGHRPASSADNEPVLLPAHRGRGRPQRPQRLGPCGSRPTWPTPTGRIGAVRLLDSWYPANHMRLVREQLAGATQLPDPPAVNLLAASVLFPAGEGAYRTDRSALVASRIDSTTDGHHHERVEAWSETRQLLSPPHPAPPPAQ